MRHVYIIPLEFPCIYDYNGTDEFGACMICVGGLSEKIRAAVGDYHRHTNEKETQRGAYSSYMVLWHNWRKNAEKAGFASLILQLPAFVTTDLCSWLPILLQPLRWKMDVLLRVLPHGP